MPEPDWIPRRGLPLNATRFANCRFEEYCQIQCRFFRHSAVPERIQGLHSTEYSLSDTALFLKNEMFEESAGSRFSELVPHIEPAEYFDWEPAARRFELAARRFELAARRFGPL